ncbi:unnamed protein product [Closterium sp. NIES-54]
MLSSLSLSLSLPPSSLPLSSPQEVPYAIEHRHVSCSVLRDGSLRIEQLLLVQSNAQRAMLVGKAGQVVRSIGREARYQLQNILGGPVHLILQARVDRN